MKNPLNSLTGRFMLYSSLVLLILMGMVYAYQWNAIRQNVEQQLLDKGRTMAISMSRTLQSITESDFKTGVTLGDKTIWSGDELRKRIFDDRLQILPESEKEAEKRLKDAEYSAGKQALFNGKEILLSKYELKYTSAYDSYTDYRWQAVIDSFLTDDQVVFAVPIAFSENRDAVGYIATHNAKYSPQGDASKDKWGSTDLLSQKFRANRVFNDPTGYKAAAYANTSEVLLQKYPRVLEGRIVETWDISYPLMLDGKHWGGVRVALSKENSDALIAKERTAMGVGLLVVFAGVLLILYLLSKFSVARKLHFMLKATSNLNSQEADLTYRLPIKGKDEMAVLAKEINRFIAHLQEMIGSVRALSSQVTDASRQLSDHAMQSAESSKQITRTMQEVAAGAQTQAVSAEDSAKAMEEMAIGIQRVAEASGQVTETSIAVVQEAETGNRTSIGAMEQMESLNQASKEVGHAIGELNERMQSVGEMTGLISGIAAQTNLLALNAAIEAARAGEHGRGFAIVADEVRKLAEQSNESARRIHEQIEAIHESMAAAVSAMEAGGREVEKGVGGVQQVSEAFGRILHMAQLVSEQMQEISASSQEMSAGTEEVTAGIEEMARIAGTASEQTRLVTSSSENQLEKAGEASEHAELLRQTAEELQQTVGRFRI